MASQTLHRGPCSQIIENAVAAFDAAYPLVCSWINAELELFGTTVRIEAEPPREGATLAAARLALSNALTGFRGFVPTLIPDTQLEVWTLFEYIDEGGKRRGAAIRLAADWGETTGEFTEERYWRSEIHRQLLLRNAPEWSDSQWRERVVESVTENAARARNWMLAGGQDGNIPLPHVSTQRVRLYDATSRPTIDGIAKQKLTTAQYNVVQTLIEAGEDGLTKDELVRKSGHTDAIGILKRLADDDADWEHVISFAGKPGGGYRIQ